MKSVLDEIDAYIASAKTCIRMLERCRDGERDGLTQLAIANALIAIAEAMVQRRVDGR